MDHPSADGSTSHILLLSDSVVQPSNSNSNADIFTDTSIAATPQESSTPTGTVVANSRNRSGTIMACLTYPPLLAPFQNPLQLPWFHPKLLQQLVLVENEH